MTASSTPRCPACSGPLPDPGRGRPSTFCSTGCRRDAEGERRRLNRRVGKLADERDRLRSFLVTYDGLDDATYGGYVEQLRRSIVEVDAQTEAAKSRLRDLLGAGTR